MSHHDSPGGGDAATIRLGEIAHARSGDKGNHANVGVIAYTAAGYEYLARELTGHLVANFFAALAPQQVERYEMPNVWAFNFVLRNALGGGAARSLRIDTQGKTLGTAILELTLPAPHDLAAMRRETAR
jgi:hypothetical protein